MVIRPIKPLTIPESRKTGKASTMLADILPTPAEERNSGFEAVCHAVGTLVRSHPSHEPLYANPHDDTPYWLCRYGWAQYNITIHTRGSKVIVSVHHKSDFISLANMEAVAEVESYLKRTIPNIKFQLKQSIGGR